MMELVYLDGGGGYTTVCICLNLVEVCTKRVNVTVFKLYLNKKIFNYPKESNKTPSGLIPITRYNQNSNHANAKPYSAL